MARSLKKGPYIDEKLIQKIQNIKPGFKTINTWSRDATITPEMIGFTFGVHNGKNFISVLIVEEMVGHRLGEFSPTTKFAKHGGRMQKELESKAGEAAAPGPVPGPLAPAPKAKAPEAKKSIKGATPAGGKGK